MTGARASMLPLVEEYLAHRHRLGATLEIEGQELRRFARYADQTGHQGAVTSALAVAWSTATRQPRPEYWVRRLSTVRLFAKYRALFDPETEIPAPGLLGARRSRPAPHIYSTEEIEALLDGASRLEPVDGLRPKTYVTLIGLLASTGLRVSEALRLTRTDVDLSRPTLTVRETKFRKSRLVPIHSSVVPALEAYARQRDRLSPFAFAPTFLVTDDGKSLGYRSVRHAFARLRRCLRVTGARSPRLLDFRHTFACRVLARWYAEGRDVQRYVLALSTYLGHVKPSDTYWYVTATPELIGLAAQRFALFAEPASEAGS